MEDARRNDSDRQSARRDVGSKGTAESETTTRLFGGPVRWTIDGPRPGDENMKIDEEMLSSGDSISSIRLYWWKPWALSLGNKQSDALVNRDVCEDLGIDVVRRPTGGRAVLHAEELTYSFTCPLRDPADAKRIYASLHSWILTGLVACGAVEGLDFRKQSSDFRQEYKDKSASFTCFTSAARYEIESNGRKVVGSAQRIRDGRLLQHGSILLGPAHETIVRLIKSDEGGDSRTPRHYHLEKLKGSAVSYGELLGQTVAPELIAAKLLDVLYA